MINSEEHERDLARARLAAPRGVYNISPWPYVMGIAFALFAVLFAAYAATKEPAIVQRNRTKPAHSGESPAPVGSPGETLIWVQ